MNMAREEAIRNFREHWASLAITGVDKDHKDDYLKRHGYSGIQDNCFLCEFTDRHCKECPVEWPVTQKDGVFPCCNSYFWDWAEAKTPEERKRLAAIIRDLPEKVEKKESAPPKYQVGDRVAPVSKSYCGPLETSVSWGKGKDQGFLYVNGIYDTDKGVYYCHPTRSDTSGDYFLESDLTPYVEKPKNHAPENKTFTEFGATFIFNGPVTVCIIDVDGRKFKGIAKCAPEDTWDENTGKGWAGLRAMHKLLKATEKNLKRNAAQAAGR